MTTEAQSESGQRSTHRRWVGGIAALAIVLSAVGGAGWWWRHPRAFDEQPGIVAGYKTWRVGETFYVVLADGGRQDGSVTVRSLEPAILSGPEADTNFLVCTTTQGIVKPLALMDNQAFHETCDRAEPAEGRRYPLSGTHLLLMSVTPSAPGELRVNGVDVDYIYGWQHGDQRIGPRVSAHVVN